MNSRLLQVSPVNLIEIPSQVLNNQATESFGDFGIPIHNPLPRI